MKKLSPRNILFFIAVGFLYFAGVAAILYPIVSNIYSLSTSRTVIMQYDTEVKEKDDSEINTVLAKADKYNEDIFHNIYHDGFEKCLCNDEGLMCYVEIPSISVYLPVYYGSSNEVLQKGCGFIENTSLPVGGPSTHAVISGHTGLPTAEMLTRLDQVIDGDMFYIHVLDRVLAYKIDNIVVVHPEIVQDLAVIKGEDHVTLLTCTPYGINDKRLLVRGTRVPYEKPEPEKIKTASPSANDQADTVLQKEISHQINIAAAIAVAAVILYIFALIWLISSGDKKPNIESGEKDVTQKTD